MEYFMDSDDTTTTTVNCPMIMVFHSNHCERILFRGWVASTIPSFVLSCLAFFVLSFLYEGLKFVREYMVLNASQSNVQSITRKQDAATDSNCPNAGYSNEALAETTPATYKKYLKSKPHILASLINLVQIMISYFLMLLFMNFNYWLCLAVILGLGLGYFCFGWIKQNVYENDCCA